MYCVWPRWSGQLQPPLRYVALSINALILKSDEHLAMPGTQIRTLLKCDMGNIMWPFRNLDTLQYAAVLLRQMSN